MAQAEGEMLVRKVGEIAMAWRGARDAAEAAALVATYRGLLRELGARGLDADVLDLMDTLPDVLMPPGWRIGEPPAPPPVVLAGYSIRQWIFALSRLDCQQTRSDGVTGQDRYGVGLSAQYDRFTALRMLLASPPTIDMGPLLVAQRGVATGAPMQLKGVLPMSTVAISRFVLRHKLLVVIFWVAATVAGVLSSGPATSALSQRFDLPGRESTEVNGAIAGQYGNGGFTAPYVAVITLPLGGNHRSSTTIVLPQAVPSPPNSLG